jgi:hypothetical protein
MKIAILYEDQRGPVRDYPLHTLVCACIADRSDRPITEIQSLLRAIPKKGNSKLLEACREEINKRAREDLNHRHPGSKPGALSY